MGVMYEGYYIVSPDEREIAFPDPITSLHDIVAVGGSLTTTNLINAYSNGIFPWYNEDEPILWQSPHERFVLPVDSIHVGRSMRKLMKHSEFTVKADTNFEAVIRSCQSMNREGQDGTWITEEIVNSYIELHQLGFAHSVECFDLEDKLVGGLYGIAIGNYFFGESMFTKVDNASKVAFLSMVKKLPLFGITMIDCQAYTENMARYGAFELPREEFISKLRADLAGSRELTGSWSEFFYC